MKKIKILLIMLLAFILCISSTPLKGIAITNEAVSQNQLIIQPFSGNGIVEKEILSAKKYVHIELYGFTSYDLFDPLVTQEKNGIDVRVMMEKAPYMADTENWDARYYLTGYGVLCKWANPSFFLTHAKFIVIDGEKVIVLTGNLTYSTFNKNREFGIVLNNPEKASEFENLFEKDWAREIYTNNDPSIVLSPNDARSKIENAFNSANSSIKIWEQSIEDPEIIETLKNAKARGVDVEIITPPLTSTPGNSDAVSELEDSIKVLVNPYVHAKAFIIDNKIAYIGSNNFTKTSLDQNREAGVFISDGVIINELLELWNIDRSNSINP
jgi:cardiolipin synthase